MKIFFAACIITIIILAPILTIWALNALFTLGIPISFTTWASTLWLASFFTFAGSGVKGGD